MERSVSFRLAALEHQIEVMSQQIDRLQRLEVDSSLGRKGGAVAPVPQILVARKLRVRTKKKLVRQG